MPRPRSGSQKLPPPLVPLSEVYLVLGISGKSLYRRGVGDMHPYWCGTQRRVSLDELVEARENLAGDTWEAEEKSPTGLRAPI